MPEAVVEQMQQLIWQRFGRTLDSFTVAQIVPQLKVPGLVIHDRGDQDVSFDDAEAIVQHWPQARLLATDGLGHRRILRDAEVIEAVVSFLSESSPLNGKLPEFLHRAPQQETARLLRNAGGAAPIEAAPGND